jgi:hypothetical protein
MRASILIAAVLGGASVSLAAAVAVGAPPPPGARPPAQHACFFHDMANGFSAPNDREVYVRVGVRDVYRLDLFGGCPNVDWTLSIGIFNRGSSWICVGDVVDLIVPDPGMGRQRCMAKVAAKLTPDEIAALPKKSRP